MQKDYLCKKFPSVEWSGVLICSIEEGSLESIDSNLTVKAHFLYPLSVDNATTTEFTAEKRQKAEKFIKEKYPDRDDLFAASIHSHNTMGVFFSGTDWTDFEDNVDIKGDYLSVVVNNRGDIIGKWGMMAQIIKPEVSIIANVLTPFDDVRFTIQDEPVASSSTTQLLVWESKILKKGIDEEYIELTKKLQEPIVRPAQTIGFKNQTKSQKVISGSAQAELFDATEQKEMMGFLLDWTIKNSIYTKRPISIVMNTVSGAAYKLATEIEQRVDARAYHKDQLMSRFEECYNEHFNSFWPDVAEIKDAWFEAVHPEHHKTIGGLMLEVFSELDIIINSSAEVSKEFKSEDANYNPITHKRYE